MKICALNVVFIRRIACALEKMVGDNAGDGCGGRESDYEMKG